MIYTYEDYVPGKKSVPVTEMARLHREMAEEIGRDPDALELYGDLMEAAVQYAAIRAKWKQMSPEAQAQADPGRTAGHNAVIVLLNVLARYLRSMGHPAAWRDRLGDEEADRWNRKSLGDFACYLAFISGLSAR